ncbi:MAG: hypothetical protein STHCBS139747_008035 [Sporothrix thermara]
MTTASTSEILDKVASFLRDESTSDTDTQQLLRYVLARPETAADRYTFSADEMDERLAFADVAQRSLKINSANCGGFSSFSFMTENLVRIFQSSLPATNSVIDHRDKQQSEMCKERDGNRCIVMGTLNPKVCHIVPLSVNNSAEELSKLQRAGDILTALFGTHSSLLLEQPGCSERAWNMLCLNRQLHDWWRRGYFAFRCLGVTPTAVVGDTQGAIVSLKFHWMPRQVTGAAASGQWKQKAPSSGHRQWVQDWNQRPRYGGGGAVVDKDGVVAAAYATTSRLVQSGHIIKVPMPSMEDGLGMKAMLDIQWACIRIASMSGAAGDLEFLKDPLWRRLAKRKRRR